MLVADNKAGYFGVYLSKPGRSKPYEAQVWRGTKNVSLGTFATAEEAALCVARSPEGRQAVVQMVTVAVAQQKAQVVEGLTLRVGKTKTGYFGVTLDQRVKTKPYAAQVRREGKMVHLGLFATAEEAALCVARSPEGQAAEGCRATPSPGNYIGLSAAAYIGRWS